MNDPAIPTWAYWLIVPCVVAMAAGVAAQVYCLVSGLRTGPRK